jgi:hypothetical protein
MGHYATKKLVYVQKYIKTWILMSSKLLKIENMEKIS